MRLDNIPPWKQELLSRRSALARTLDPDIVDSKKTLPSPKLPATNILSHQRERIDGATKSSTGSNDNPCGRQKRPLAAISDTFLKFKTITCEGTTTQASPSNNKANGRALFSSITPLQSVSVAGDPGRQRSAFLSWPKDQQKSSTAAADVPAVPSGSSPKLNGSLTKRKTHGDPRSVIWNKAGLNKQKMGEEEVIIGSDADSDSSEDLHYGPGFVSRLKSKYMSAALKSATGSTSFGLRRTASLEEFLDKDKEEVSIELNQPPIYKRKTSEDSSRLSRKSVVANKVQKKSRDSIKRCQSVEVLSRQPLPLEKPPPLPPKKLEQVLNSEALANDNIKIEEIKTTNHKVEETMMILPLISNSKQKEYSTTPTTVIASLRKHHYRRRSAGLLFGVVEKELPAPDTVKETRKIFEKSSAITPSNRQGPPLIKSRSTSSLYQLEKASACNKDAPPTLPSPKNKNNTNHDNNSISSGSENHNNKNNNFADKSRENNNKSSPNSKPKLPTKPDFQFPIPSLRRTMENNGGKIQNLENKKNVNAMNNHHNKSPVVELEEGIKLITEESIENIRKSGGESFSFNFKKTNSSTVSSTTDQLKTTKPYLPQKKVNTNISDSAIDAIPVGVIKPISRNEDNQQQSQHQQITNRHCEQTNKSNKKVESPKSRTTLNNLINLAKESTKTTTGAKKEVVGTVIDKKPPPPPPPSTQVLCPPIVDSKHINKSNNNSNNFNSNHNFTEKTRENKVVTFADTIEIETTKPPSPSKILDEGIVDPDQGDRENMIMMMSTNGDHKNGSSNNGNNANDYRNNWKKQRDTENKNTMVFNFLNTQKDVTHIENDGLDLSQRKKKNFFSKAKETGVVIIKNGLDQDQEDEDEGLEEESDSDSGLGASVPPCAVIFIGANVSTGKSSIKLRPRDKKLNISFSKSLTQVYEYPSFESVADEETINKNSNHNKSSVGITSKNNTLGSFGGLGSYTPSKMSRDNPFQLGVSRTVPHASKTPSAATVPDSNPNPNSNPNSNPNPNSSEEVLRPTEDAISWSGSSSSSDMLF